MDGGNEHPSSPYRRAVALRYDAQTGDAPKVVAKGERLVASRIVELAREHGVHVHEDPALVSMLAKLELNEEIPEALYAAVAEVLAFVYRLDKRMPTA